VSGYVVFESEQWKSFVATIKEKMILEPFHVFDERNYFSDDDVHVERCGSSPLVALCGEPLTGRKVESVSNQTPITCIVCADLALVECDARRE
jgi:hypothetical protein